MLFNSPVFVLGFLPVAVAGFFLAGRIGGGTWALRWLVVASLFFYGWWNPRFVGLLAGSILVNYGIAELIRLHRSRAWLIGGIAANLAVLGWFKYANFFVTACCGSTRRRSRSSCPWRSASSPSSRYRKSGGFLRTIG
ncbi:MAG: hypothetical protein WDN25_13555 [Acetobacteraceae bacterium]